MTDHIKSFVTDYPTVGDTSYAIYYPYDGGLDVGFDTPSEAWDWYFEVTGSDATEPEEASGAYVVRVQIERVEANK